MIKNLAPWLEKKLVEPVELETKVEELRSQGLTIVTLNGSFDLLHAGHLYIIHQASLQGDRLILCLNTDRSIQQYKSPKRPIITLSHRLEMIAALEFVDYVTWFDELNSIEILSKIKPDVHVNGAEYGADCIEAETVRFNGGKLYLVDRIPNLATSEVLEKVRLCD
jgi:D-glycero-beta-D-manno-heptose 1-phosphate adenylyltransferase